MLQEFKALSDAERETMYNVIPLITILVAGADNNIDEVELAQAKKLADIRSFRADGKLNGYYEQIEEGLTDKIMSVYNHLPAGVKEREEVLWTELSKLNLILPKLPSPYHYLYYKSFHSFAEHVAQAHGGLLRFITVGPKEAKVMNLPMVMQIEKPAVDADPDLF